MHITSGGGGGGGRWMMDGYIHVCMDVLHTGQGGAVAPNPMVTNQILQNWAKYLQMNFGGLTPQQLASNPLYQQMVRQQQYWALLRQQQLMQLQQAAGVSVAGHTVSLTPAQIHQLQGRMALRPSAAGPQVLHQQTTVAAAAAGQPTRNGVASGGAVQQMRNTSGQTVPGQALGRCVLLGHPQQGAASVVLQSASQSGTSASTRVSQSSQKVTTK